jgi:hypothetical protein
MNGQTSKSDVTVAIAGSDAIQERRCIAQDFLLMWLDAEIDQSKQDYQKTLALLRSVVNDVNMFTQPDECVDFLTDVKDETTFLIVTGTVDQQLISLIHDIPQLDEIYIFCDNKSSFEQWIMQWEKVKGIYGQNHFNSDVTSYNLNMFISV